MSSSRTLRQLQRSTPSTASNLVGSLAERGYTRANTESGFEYSSPSEEFTSYQDKKLRQTGQFSKETYYFDSFGNLLKRVEREPALVEAYGSTTIREIREKAVDDYLNNQTSYSDNRTLTTLQRNQIAENQVKSGVSSGVPNVVLQQQAKEQMAANVAAEKARRENVKSVTVNRQTGVVVKTLRAPTYQNTFDIVQEKNEEKREAFYNRLSIQERDRIKSAIKDNPDAVLIGVEGQPVRDLNRDSTAARVFKENQRVIGRGALYRQQGEVTINGGLLQTRGSDSLLDYRNFNDSSVNSLAEAQREKTRSEQYFEGAGLTAKEFVTIPLKGAAKFSQLYRVESPLDVILPGVPLSRNKQIKIAELSSDRDVQAFVAGTGIITTAILVPPAGIAMGVGFTLSGIKRGVEGYFKGDFKEVGAASVETAFNVGLPFLSKIKSPVKFKSIKLSSSPEVIITEPINVKSVSGETPNILTGYDDFKPAPVKSIKTFGLEIGSRAQPLITFTDEGIKFGTPNFRNRISLSDLDGNTQGTPQPERALEGIIFRRKLALTPEETIRIEEGFLPSARILKGDTGLKVEDAIFNVEGLKNPKTATKLVEDFLVENDGVVFGSSTTQQLPIGFRTLKPGDVDVQFPSLTVDKISQAMLPFVEKLKASGENVRISPNGKGTIIEFLPEKGQTQGNKFLEAKSGIDQATAGLDDAAPAGVLGFMFPNLKAGQIGATVPFGRTRALLAGEQFLRKGAGALIVSPGKLPGETGGFSQAGILGKQGNPRGLKDVAGFVQSGKGLVEIRRQSWNPITRIRAERANRALDRYLESFTPEQQTDILIKLSEGIGNEPIPLAISRNNQRVSGNIKRISGSGSPFLVARQPINVDNTLDKFEEFAYDLKRMNEQIRKDSYEIDLINTDNVKNIRRGSSRDLSDLKDIDSFNKEIDKVIKDSDLSLTKDFDVVSPRRSSSFSNQRASSFDLQSVSVKSMLSNDVSPSLLASLRSRPSSLSKSPYLISPSIIDMSSSFSSPSTSFSSSGSPSPSPQPRSPSPSPSGDSLISQMSGFPSLGSPSPSPFPGSPSLFPSPGGPSPFPSMTGSPSPPPSPSIKSPPNKPPKRLPIMFPSDDFGVSKTGYNVYVKEGAPKGKKTPKREVKVNDKPLPYNMAWNLGEDYVDNSSARSLRLKPAGKTKLVDDPFRQDIGKYRVSKNGKYAVEKSQFAIDSVGELNQITAQALKKQRKKQGRGLFL